MVGSAVDARPVGLSLGDLYRLHAGEATQVARAVTRNADDAADAVAEAFAGVLRAVATGRMDSADVVRPYLLAATRNAAIDIVRGRGRVTTTDRIDALDGVAHGAGPSDRLVAGENANIVGRAFADLPPRWQAVLWLTEVEGLAARDAAPLLGLTPNGAAQLAVRARTGLRRRYVQFHVRNHATGDCLEAAERLGALVAGDLTEAQANRVRGHLAECEDCRDRLGELEDVGLALRRATWVPAVAAGLRLRRLRLWHHGSRARPMPWGRPRRADPLVAWASRLSPAATDAAAVVAQAAGSPVVQQVAGAVTAGLLVLGVGAAVVRHEDTSAARPTQPAAQLAAPPSFQPGPVTPTTTVALVPDTTATTTTTTTSTTSTSAPAASTAPNQGSPTAAASPPPAAAAPFTPRGPLLTASRSTVAHALGAQLAVYDTPGDAGARLVLANPRPSGAPLVLLVVGQQPGWLQVLLPVRPNGSSGWIRDNQVSLTTIDYRIVVELGAHRITAYQGTDVLVSEPIGVGTAEAPTPGGLYFITELFQPDDGPNGPYGAYAYGLSGHSDVLYDFAGGDGQFGIHGTNDPSGLGHDVSHGCIRMSNAGITRLAAILPLGVPVEIVA
ncbi:MAG TPA: sigma-70 family RNA polymerase sigma factor [Acidimicrobiales bacterium]|nr:sigma-70 family RNA polymerase sigma factor [Acidimicrobiales bacterium]